MQFLLALVLATAVSAGLLAMESLSLGSGAHGYLLWNLFLAWIPFGLALWLRSILQRRLWSSWNALGLSAAWLAFLPNSFYMVSDLIHLAEFGPDQILMGAVTFTSFVFTSMCLGVASLYIVHQEFLKRVSPRTAAGIAAALLFITSIAIYVGRDLRWNSWDVVFNPFGLLFDLSDRLLHPSEYGQILAVILPFFALLVTVYYLVWAATKSLRSKAS